MPDVPGQTGSVEERKARVLLEKKTIINLVGAFSVSVKHYLRGEEGIYYEDLYHLVKFLPSYALPAGLPSVVDVNEMPRNRSSDGTRHSISSMEPKQSTEGQLPLPITAEPRFPTSGSLKVRPGDLDSSSLLPARDPPHFAIFDVFPFSLLVHRLTKIRKDIERKRAAQPVISHNIPLEISLYLVRFQLSHPFFRVNPSGRAPTSLLCKPGPSIRPRLVSTWMKNLPNPYLFPLAPLLNALLSLTDSLTGLERILTTPIPFSYSIHLWTVTIIYCLALPFQIWNALGWITIPGTTAVVSGTSSIVIVPLTDNRSIPGFRLLRFLGCWRGNRE